LPIPKRVKHGIALSGLQFVASFSPYLGSYVSYDLLYITYLRVWVLLQNYSPTLRNDQLYSLQFTAYAMQCIRGVCKLPVQALLDLRRREKRPPYYRLF
jgi:hypothetical protein